MTSKLLLNTLFVMKTEEITFLAKEIITRLPNGLAQLLAKEIAHFLFLEEHKYMNKKDAARFLGITPGALQKKTEKGQILCGKMGHLNMYKIEDLEALRDSLLNGSTNEQI